MKQLILVTVVAACCNSNHGMIDAPNEPVDAHADAPPDVAIDAPPRATAGMIQISQGTGAGSAQSSVDANFSTSLFGTPAGTDGPCTLYPTAGAKQKFSAGTISITGTVSAITLSPSGTAPNVSYTAGTIPDPVFTAGATISVSGAGGPDVGAFSGSVTAPAALAGYTAPTTSISRSGYTATWTAGSGPAIWVIAAGFNSISGAGDIVICQVADNGSFTIPSTTFAMLPASADSGFAGIGRVATATVSAGATMIDIEATSYITSGVLTLGP